MYLKPAYILLPVARSLPCHAIARLTIVQKVSCHACCQHIELESTLLSLSFTPTLQSGDSPSHSFSWLCVSRYTHIYTHVLNAVMLVWGSLRLPPIINTSVSQNCQRVAPWLAKSALILVMSQPTSAKKGRVWWTDRMQLAGWFQIVHSWITFCGLYKHAPWEV